MLKCGSNTEKVKFLTEKQVYILLDALDKEYKAVFREHDRVDDTGKPYHVDSYTESYHLPLQLVTFYYVALFGGLRRGENISLTWDDIDFKTNTISINKATAKMPGGQYLKAPKTKNSYRTVTVPDEVIHLLNRLKMEQNTYRLSIGENWIETLDENGKPLNFVYTQANGKQMYIDTPSQRFTKLIKDYNQTVEKEEDKLPDISLHGLRHTMATLLIGEGMEISTVSGRLGHADISTTLDIYTHFLKDHDKTASDTLEKFTRKKNII
ncbi:MAG: site-specific integrase [Lachnospiraceae bacterium]